MKKTILYSMIILGSVACCGQPKTNKTGLETTDSDSVSVTANSVATDSIAADSTQGNLCGGYSVNRALKPEELELFRTAIAQIDGVGYTPESVATQIVAGTNYKFTCSASTTTLNPKTYKAEVVIYAALPHTKQEPRISSITRIE